MLNVIGIGEKIDKLVSNAKEALDEYMELDQKAVDKIVEAMASAGVQNHVELAKMAIEETHRGVLEDKIIKNKFSCECILKSIKNKKTVGIIEDNEDNGIITIADPLGVIAGVTPVTNPTSTTIFKSLICVKTRNPIIFGFHPGAQKCSVAAAKIMLDAAVKAGAPKNCIQWIDCPSIEATSRLMNHPGVNVVLATGGPGMVKSAYSTGKPALGVGPGNAPCYVDKTANIKSACNDIIFSKTFDNGMICASEQSVIAHEEIADEFEKIMAESGCKFLDDIETEKLQKYMINPEKNVLNGFVAGQSACEIAKKAGISVPENTKILIVKPGGVGKEYPLSFEKLSPVLSYYKAKNSEEGIKICKQVLKFGGEGHTAAIHTNNEELIKEFGLQVDAGRIIVNSPSSQGAIGGLYNCAVPSLTLGCGSKGRNSTTDNISVENLLNLKRIFKRKDNIL